MSENSNYIWIGFYDNFKRYDTVLISVDMNGLLEVNDVFKRLSEGLTEFDFSELRLLDKKFRINMKAYQAKKNSGMLQVDKGKFEWRLTKEKWRRFHELLTHRSKDGGHGHHYLDAEEGDIEPNSLQVVFSLDEYPYWFWEEHFPRCIS